MRKPAMNTYLCSYSRDGEKFYFKCQADDNEHAAEQLLDAEPLAEDIFCEIFSRVENEQ